MKVLVACEFSGTVRDAFLRAGHDAVSCDLLPTESEGPHIEGDVFEHLFGDWDLIIAHPPCTRLCNSGVRWLAERDLWAEMRSACTFFNSFKKKAPKVCIENPIPHRYARELIGPYDQKVQPWQFGHPETKATCFWLEHLPPLEPTQIVEGRETRVHHASPGPNRWKERSRFFPGIAKAMAEQWG